MIPPRWTRQGHGATVIAVSATPHSVFRRVFRRALWPKPRSCRRNM